MGVGGGAAADSNRSIICNAKHRTVETQQDVTNRSSDCANSSSARMLQFNCPFYV